MPLAQKKICDALVVLMLGAALGGPALAAEAPPPDVQAEVGHLLDYLERSGCRFMRNGAWHDAKSARAHIKKKYDYLVRKGLVERTEDFIRYAASESSTSGDPYQVQCGGGAPVASATWLNAELQRYRSGAAGRP